MSKKVVRKKKPVKPKKFRVYFCIELTNCYRDVEADCPIDAMGMVDGDWVEMKDLVNSDPVTIRAEHVEELK